MASRKLNKLRIISLLNILLLFHKGESVLRDITDSEIMSVYDLEIKTQKLLKDFSDR